MIFHFRSLTLLSLLLTAGMLSGASLHWQEGRGWHWDAPPPPGSADRQLGTRVLDMMDDAKALELAGDLRASRRLYRDVVRAYPESLYAAESLFQIGLIEERRRNWQSAFNAFQEIIDNHPNYGRFNRVIAAQFQVADGLMQGNRVRFLGTLPIFRSPETAIGQFRRIIDNAPFSEFAPLSLMNIAILQRSRSQPVETIDALDRFINSYPRHFLLPDAYLLMAQTYASMVQGPDYDQGTTREAIAYYEDFLSQFPRSNLVGEAEKGLREMREMLGRSKLVMADWYFRYRSNYVAARILYSEVITLAAGTDAAERAQSQIERIDAGGLPGPGFFSGRGSMGDRPAETPADEPVGITHGPVD